MNPASTLKLGHARAAAMLAPARAGLPVAEYAAATGQEGGGRRPAHADKTQIAFMVAPAAARRPASLTADAADALAVAITHAHLRSGTALRGAA